MKTDADRMALIRQRTAQLQRQARARQMLLRNFIKKNIKFF